MGVERVQNAGTGSAVGVVKIGSGGNSNDEHMRMRTALPLFTVLAGGTVKANGDRHTLLSPPCAAGLLALLARTLSSAAQMATDAAVRRAHSRRVMAYHMHVPPLPA